MKAMQKSINRVAAHNDERPSTRSTKAHPNAEMELLCIYMLDNNRKIKSPHEITFNVERVRLYCIVGV